MNTNSAEKSLWTCSAIALLTATVLTSAAHVSAQAADGAPLWTNIFNGAANSADSPKALTVDGEGNVYVAGYSSVNGYSDYATIKYSSAGAPSWTNLFNGVGNNSDSAEAVAVDNTGNVYVTGSSSGSARTYYAAYATIKYSSTGLPLWTNMFDGGGLGDSRARALAVDGSGNVYVTGSAVRDNSGAPDYATIKYSNAGAPLWTNYFNGTRKLEDVPYAIAVDDTGDVYVTGFGTFGSVAHYFSAFTTIKYSSAGAPLWTNLFIFGNHDLMANSIAVDSNRNVYVTGSMDTSLAATIKYSSTGVPSWTNFFNGAAYYDNTRVKVDGNGDVYVSGSSMQPSGDTDYVTIKYSGAGLSLWTNLFDGGLNSDDDALALAVDANKSVYVTGRSDRIGSFYRDFATIKYSTAGVPVWTNFFDGPGNGFDDASAIDVTGGGDIYVTGVASGTTSDDWATIKYSGAGASSFPPIPLEMKLTGNQAVISWTNANFSLQTAPQATSIYTNVPGATSPHTNLINDSQRFFRLIKN